MSSETIITAAGLGKKYRRYTSVAEGLKEVFHPLRKKYHREFWALRDLSFEIKRGESVGIVGRNGSGKSTLLQVLCGIMPPTEGSVHVAGRVAALLELGAGFHPKFTGRENIFLNGAIMGLSRAEIEERYADVAAFADIGDFIDQPVRTYSSGMYVRLAFAAAINVNADILVVDEALAVGDMFFQARCMQKIKSLMDDGVTILFVTHDINTVKALCSKCLYLDRGAMKAFGPSGEVVDKYVRGMSTEAMKEYENKTPVMPVFSAGDEYEEVKGLFKDDPEFARRFESIRHGTGEARVTAVELLDADGHSVEEVEFNQEVTIRIHLMFDKPGEFNVSYQIRDDKSIPVLSSTCLVESGRMLTGNAGDRFVVDFKTRLPLFNGNYNVVLRIARPVMLNVSAYVADSIDNAIVFMVLERLPFKSWSRVYIPNDMHVGKEVG